MSLNIAFEKSAVNDPCIHVTFAWPIEALPKIVELPRFEPPTLYARENEPEPAPEPLSEKAAWELLQAEADHQKQIAAAAVLKKLLQEIEEEAAQISQWLTDGGPGGDF